jgi:hypothetical protein
LPQEKKRVPTAPAASAHSQGDDLFTRLGRPFRFIRFSQIGSRIATRDRVKSAGKSMARRMLVLHERVRA